MLMLTMIMPMTVVTSSSNIDHNKNNLANCGQVLLGASDLS